MAASLTIYVEEGELTEDRLADALISINRTQGARAIRYVYVASDENAARAQAITDSASPLRGFRVLRHKTLAPHHWGVEGEAA